MNHVLSQLKNISLHKLHNYIIHYQQEKDI